MTDRYEALRETYDTFVRGIMPDLTAEKADLAIDHLNRIMRLQRPANWAMNDEPAVILGITSDKEKVAYGESGQLRFYHVVPYKEVFERVSRMVDKAGKDCSEAARQRETIPNLETFLFQSNQARLEHVKKLVEDLISLKPE